MQSSITIDGLEIPGDVDLIEQVYALVTEIIDDGRSETITIGGTAPDYRTRTALHITPTTSVRAFLAWNPTETIPDHLETPTIA